MTKNEKPVSNKKLYLLDAYALIFRAYYAFINNPIKTSGGLNTSAIYGFVNALNDIITNQKPSHIAIAFDPPSPTFRHKEFDEYKANRDATPEDIKKAVPIIKEIINAYNIPVIEVDGFEADDAIGTMAKNAEKQGFDVYMMTSDKDFAQLVSDKIFMYKPGRGSSDAVIWDCEKVKEKFKVDKPEQVIDVLALWGDASDNIPGAPGIGEKTSKNLISKYGNIENIYHNIDDFKGKQKENLIKYRDQIKLSRKLVKIILDVPVKLEEEKMKIVDPDKKKLLELFKKLEFKRLSDHLQRSDKTAEGETEKPAFGQGTLFAGSGDENMVKSTGRKTIDNTTHDYILLDTGEKEDELVGKITRQKEFCFDTETTSLDTEQGELVGISFCCESHKAYWLPVDGEVLKSKSFRTKFVPLFGNENIIKVGQNLKFDIKIMQNAGIYVNGPLFDTMIAHYLIKPDGKHGLNDMAEDYLNYTPVKIEELIGIKGKNQKSIPNVPPEKLKDYAAEDADLTWQIKKILEKELKNKKLEKLAGNIEMPLVYVLGNMESKGFRLDVDALKRYSVKLKEELLSIQEKIYKLSGTEFNVSSPKQLGEILFGKMKIESKARKTKTGQYSTNEETLQRLEKKHEIIPAILEFRSVSKLLSTYVEKLPGLINKKTGKIHSSFNQTIAATGRLSSNNPNLQNIPIREERGKEIRKAFVPSDNSHILISADYSQIELRLMAHMSGDRNMISAFREGKDIHLSTASEIYNLPPGEVTREMRGKAKTANFGIIYGISAYGLSQRMNLPLSEAKNFIEEYFNAYPGVKEYMGKSIDIAREKGYVETLMGRKRYLPDIHSRNATVRGFAERNAINAPIQGSAADIIKIAMIKIHKKIVEKNLKLAMILQVHDELVFDVPDKEIDKLQKIVVNEMEGAVSLKVPLTVDLGTGNNWLEAH